MKSKIIKIMKFVEEISISLGYPITESDYYVEDMSCPHVQPRTLPKGYGAVYFFIFGDTVMKIGKVNPKSNARYVSHHYNCSAPSTFAKSLLKDQSMQLDHISVKQWILTNTQRINILIKEDKGKAATELVEAIMHYYFRPRYEGNI